MGEGGDHGYVSQLRLQVKGIGWPCCWDQQKPPNSNVDPLFLSFLLFIYLFNLYFGTVLYVCVILFREDWTDT